MSTIEPCRVKFYGKLADIISPDDWVLLGYQQPGETVLHALMRLSARFSRDLDIARRLPETKNRNCHASTLAFRLTIDGVTLQQTVVSDSKLSVSTVDTGPLELIGEERPSKTSNSVQSPKA